MENPEGVGLITAMVVSGGFVLLSKLLDRTVTHLLNYKRRQNRCASRSIALAQPNSRPHPPPADIRKQYLASDHHLCIDSTSSRRRIQELSIFSQEAATAENLNQLVQEQIIAATQHLQFATPIVPTIHESSPSLMNPQEVLSNVDQAPTKFDAYLRRRHSEPAHGHDDRRIIDAVSSKYYHDIKEPCCLVKKYLDKVPNEKRLSRLRRHQRMKEERRSVPSLSDSARGHDSSAASATSSRPSARSASAVTVDEKKRRISNEEIVRRRPIEATTEVLSHRKKSEL